MHVVPLKLRTKDLCILAIQKNAYTFEYVPDELKTEEICEMGVKKYGWVLRYVPHKLITKELCEIAVQKDGRALEYVPLKLKTEEICEMSVKKYGEALEHIPKELRTKELFLTAIEKGLKFYHIPEALWTYRIGHQREEKTKRQSNSCNILLNKRGYKFDLNTNTGVKIYSLSENNKIDGWMARKDLEWLYNTSKNMKSVVEIGSWKGRSTYALLSGCVDMVHTIDHFLGSQERKDKTTLEAQDSDIHKIFINNVGHFNNLVVLKMDSAEAASKFEDKTIDMVFLDGDHSQESVAKDIELWLPKVTKMICGHDINFSTVHRAVSDSLGDYKIVKDIWFKDLCNY